MKCCMHLCKTENDETIDTFTEKSFAKFMHILCWKMEKSRRQRAEIATECDKIGNNFKLCDLSLGFYKKYFSHFKNKTWLKKCRNVCFEKQVDQKKWES